MKIRVLGVLLAVLALPFFIILLMGIWVVVVLSIMLQSKAMDQLCERLDW